MSHTSSTAPTQFINTSLEKYALSALRKWIGRPTAMSSAFHRNPG
jgi:hypothetical protein